MKFIDLNMNAINTFQMESSILNFNWESLSTVLLKKDFSCKNGLIKLKFIIVGMMYI